MDIYVEKKFDVNIQSEGKASEMISEIDRVCSRKLIMLKNGYKISLKETACSKY